eukprot:10641526-Prorocentrum_lima.AAC.1
MSVPHESVEGEQGGEPRRAMGRNIKVVTGKAYPDTLVLSGILHGSPFFPSRCSRYGGRNSKDKR